MDGVTKLKSYLQEKGHSVTKPRLLVFEFLQRSEKPVSITEIATSLQNIGVDRASIYRTMNLYEKIGVLHRVWTGFKSKVELSESFSDHHHHFTCTNCAKITSFESRKLENSLKQVEKENGLKLTHHSVELAGYCADCRAK